VIIKELVKNNKKVSRKYTIKCIQNVIQERFELSFLNHNFKFMTSINLE